MEWIQIFPSAEQARQRLTDNKPQLVIVRGKRICLVRRNDAFHAVQDACTHNSESLSKGTVNFMGEVVCPLHGYHFSIRTGRESSERSRDLEVYPVRVDETGFYIGI